MSDTEEIPEKPKVKKERTPAQIEATKKMLLKRAQIDKIKREHTAAKKIEKELNLQEKAIKTKEILKKEQEMSNYKSDEEEDKQEELRSEAPEGRPKQEIIVKKPKQKPKAKKIIYQEESSSESEPEIVYVKSKKSKKKKPKKKVVYSSSSEESEEEVKPKKKQHATDKINYNSEEQLKRDLQEERLRSALANLGFI